MKKLKIKLKDLNINHKEVELFNGDEGIFILTKDFTPQLKRFVFNNKYEWQFKEDYKFILFIKEDLIVKK